jgi:hypothetical protein
MHLMEPQGQVREMTGRIRRAIIARELMAKGARA